MMLRKFMAVLMAAVSVCLVSCSSDDSEPLSSKVTCPSTSGVTTAYADAFARVYPNGMTSFRGVDDQSTLLITAVNDNTVRVAYVSNLWGPATFESVSVAESKGAYLMEGTGSIKTPDLFKGGSAEDAVTYENFTFSGYVSADSTSYIIKGQLGNMGVLTLKFTPNE